MSEAGVEGEGGRIVVDLLHLPEQCPALSPDHLRSLAEAAATCLEECGHPSGVSLKISGSFDHSAELLRLEVTEQMGRTYSDPEEATEWGACGIAIFLIRILSPFCVIERSAKGRGFDYWLGEDGDMTFARKARLEVSGIRHGQERDLQSRTRVKLRQISQSDGSHPGYVVVVLFETPETRVTRK